MLPKSGSVVNQILPKVYYMYSPYLPHYVNYIIAKTNNYHIDQFLLIQRTFFTISDPCGSTGRRTSTLL